MTKLIRTVNDNIYAYHNDSTDIVSLEQVKDTKELGHTLLGLYGENDNSFDALIADKIQQVIESWESQTGFYLRHQERRAYLPEVESFTDIEIGTFNVEKIHSIKYHPHNWNYATPVKMSFTDYLWINQDDILTSYPHLKNKHNKPLCVYKLKNNVEIAYDTGFKESKLLPKDIKQWILINVHYQIDKAQGLQNCQDSDMIASLRNIAFKYKKQISKVPSYVSFGVI